jgi:hypothetical protein
MHYHLLIDRAMYKSALLVHRAGVERVPPCRERKNRSKRSHLLLPSTQRLVTWIVPLPRMHARLPRYMPAPLSWSATGTTITNAP